MVSTNHYQKQQTEYLEFGAALSGDKFVRNIVIEKSQLGEYRKKYNNTGVYTTIYRYLDKNNYDGEVIGPFYLDLDCPEDFEKVRQDAITALKYLSNILGIDKDKIKIYFSGKKGIHIVVSEKILGIEPRKDLNKIYKMLAEDIDDVCPNDTIDLRIYDNRRMFRLPLSIHQHTKLYKVQISYNELVNLPLKEIRSLAKSPRLIETGEPELVLPAQSIVNGKIQKLNIKPRKKTPVKSYSNHLQHTPPCADHLLKTEVLEGNRNNTAIALGSYLKQRGYTYEQAEQIINDWNENYCNPPIGKDELKKTIRQSYTKEYEYGCSTMKEISVCEESECKLKRGRV